LKSAYPAWNKGLKGALVHSDDSKKKMSDTHTRIWQEAKEGKRVRNNK